MNIVIKKEWLRRMAQPGPSWLIASCVAWAFASAPPIFATPVPRPLEPSGAIQHLASRQRSAPQLPNATDAGDFYVTPGGERRLFRLDGSVAVRFRRQVSALDESQELIAAGGLLDGYIANPEAIKGVTVFQVNQLERQRQRDSRSYRDTLAKVRRAAGVLSANPVFVEPGTGLARIAAEEILICLRPQTDPQSYFGDSWSSVRPLRATDDKFILTRPGATAEEMFAESNWRAADPRVAWAEPNFISQVIKQSADPLFTQQWTLNNTGLNGARANADVNAPEGWNFSTGSNGVIIAILDDGVQLNHPDLVANIFSAPGHPPGWDFFRDDTDPGPELANDNHGTAVAGIAAGLGDNNLGGAGIAYHCQIMPLKVLADGEWASDSAIAKAIYYAAGRALDGTNTWRGADIISISLSFPRSAVVDSALEWAAINGRGGKGCPIFAAAGDEASRWMPTRIHLPVGAVAGPGVCRFAFEYSKDGDDSYGAGEDMVKIDNVALLADDGVTQLDSSLGPNGRQDFEGAFPPPGWQLTGSYNAPVWHATTSGAFTGTRGLASAQSGPITARQWTELRTPPITLTGSEILSFSCYVSSERNNLTGEGYDGLKVWVLDADGHYAGNVFEGSGGDPLISGNIDVSDSIDYPANHPNVIAVGASTDCDMRADYSNYGTELEFLAPSSGGWSDVVTTDRTGADGYTAGDYTAEFGGTSAACPLAAGIGALVLSIKPQTTPAELRTILRNSCDKIGDVAYDANGWNQYYGYGRINAQRAVEAAVGPFRLAIIGPANNAILLSPTNVMITVMVTNRDAKIKKVEFFDGTVRLGEATNAPFAFVWKNPSHGRHTLTAHAIDIRGSNVYSTTVGVSVVPSISVGDTTVTEGSSGTTNATFTVRLSSKLTQTVTVDFTVADGTAVAGKDYVPVGGRVTFLPGNTSQLVRVAVMGNRLSESNRTFFVNLTNPVNALIARPRGIGTIIDNDPVPAVSINDVSVMEGNSGTTNALFTLKLSTVSGRMITVQYGTANGSAVGDVDFVRRSGTVTFQPGETNRTLPIAVIGDILSESNKTFFVNLSNVVNATIVDRQGICTILDDDPVASISIADTAVVEGRGGTTNAIFTVSLSTRSGKTITVNYATANDSALAGRDFVATSGTLRFAPGTTSQTIRVAVIGEALSESNETFLVNLSSPVNATIAAGQGVGTILNDDLTPTLSISDATVTEGNSGATNASFIVRLSAVSGRTITVDYATSDGTALAGSDYVPTNGTVTFPPGSVSQIIRIAVIGDRLSESNETFFANLTNSVNATITDSQGRGTIIDNDPLPALFINDISVAEGNSENIDAVFTVRLSAASGRTVTVKYATSNAIAKASFDYVATNGTLVFQPGITNLPIAITILADGLLETNETFAVNLTMPTNAIMGDAHGVCTIRDSIPQLMAAQVGETNPASDFRIVATRIVGPDVLISFVTLPGQPARLEYTDAPLGASNVWQTVPGAANMLGTGSVITATNLGGANQPLRFYRVRLLP